MRSRQRLRRTRGACCSPQSLPFARTASRLLRPRGVTPVPSRAGVSLSRTTRRSVSRSHRSLRCCAEGTAAHAVRRGTALRERARQERRRRRSDGIRPHHPAARRLRSVRRSCTRITASVATSASRPWMPAASWPSSRARVRRGDKLYVPQSRSSDQPLHGCAGGIRAAAQARQRPVVQGPRPGPRHGSGTRLRNCSTCNSRRAAREGYAFAWTKRRSAHLRRDSRSRRPRTGRRDRTGRGRLRSARPMIGSSAATWDSARPRWHCGPQFIAVQGGKQSRYWFRRRCSRSSTTRPSPTASPTGRCASSCCRVSEATRRRRWRSRVSPTARWTSSSARTLLQPACASRTSGC